MTEAAIKVQGTVLNLFLLIFSGLWAVGAVLLLLLGRASLRALTPTSSLPWSHPSPQSSGSSWAWGPCAEQIWVPTQACPAAPWLLLLLPLGVSHGSSSVLGLSKLSYLGFCVFPPWYQSTGHRCRVWCPTGPACGLPPQPLQFLLSLTSTCLLSWALGRSLHPSANYSLIISAYQNIAFQLPFILLFACQVTSPSPRCRHCVQGWQHFLISHPVPSLSCTLPPQRSQFYFPSQKRQIPLNMQETLWINWNKLSPQISCTAPEPILQQNKSKRDGSQACQGHLRLGRLIFFQV